LAAGTYRPVTLKWAAKFMLTRMSRNSTPARSKATFAS
jgi:hypothetical protein